MNLTFLLDIWYSVFNVGWEVFMSTGKITLEYFRSRRSFLSLCAIVLVLLIALCCGIWIMSREKQVILSVNNNETKLFTSAKTLSELLEEQDISSEDVVASGVELDALLCDGQEIDVEVAFDFKIFADGDIHEIRMAAASVEDVLNEVGITLGEQDVVEPGLHEKIIGDTVIDLHRVTVEDEIVETELSYTVEKKRDTSLGSGEKQILQAGVYGLRKDTYRITYWDGEFYSEELIASEITDPVTEIVAVGSGVSILADENKTNVDYLGGTPPKGISSEKTLTLKATAYHEPEGSLTKSGTLSRVGAVAVDPEVIPLGTRLYVEGYGYCVAEDTGGLIKGNRIDLYFDSEEECIDWGVRNVTVYILDGEN